MTDLDARRRRIEATLQDFAGQLEDGIRPDFATQGVSLALAWWRGLAVADRPIAQAVWATWLRTGTTEQLRLAARLTAEQSTWPAALAQAVAIAWTRTDAPPQTREELGIVMRKLVLAGQIAWQVGWRPLLQAPGGHAALGAALVGDRTWTLAHLGPLLGDTLSSAMLRLLNATSGLNRAESMATWGDLAREGVGLSDEARARCAAMVDWVRDHGEEPAGDGRLRWQTT